jgi:DNA-damage-inducible protein D
LNYSLWQNFNKVIDKAKIACQKANQKVEDHFIGVNKMVKLGSGAERQVEDILLTRYACYLIAQNGDPRKEQIAFAQTYFAVQTRKAELIEQRLMEIERVKARTKLQETEKHLSGILYTISIKAKDFAAEMTNVNVQQKNLYGEGQIATEHVDNNKAVRKMMIDRGIVPENLPPAEDVKKVERRLASEEKKALENKNNKGKKKK